MSGDPEQEFFADGLTEDIITELSRFRDLLVISRNAVFVHKGKPVKAQEVAREFGVDYVVEGSVRKAADRVRVTVQLIDGETETHVWAERYDRKLEDIFAIQDEVTSAIVATLARPRRGGDARARQAQADREHGGLRIRADRQGAAPLVGARRQCRGAAHARRGDRARPEIRARACLEGLRDSARPGCYGWCEDKDARCQGRSTKELQTALALDDNDPDVHRILAALNLNFNNYDKAHYHQERALSLNPNSDLIVVQQGEVLTWLGRPEEGIEWIRKAMRLNPYHPERFWSHLGRAQYTAQALCRCDAVLQPHHRRPTTRTMPSWPPPRRRWATPPRRPRMRARCSQREPAFTIAAYLGDAALQAGRRPRALPRGARQGRAAGLTPPCPPASGRAEADRRRDLGVEALLEGRRAARRVQVVGVGLVEEVVQPQVEARVLVRRVGGEEVDQRVVVGELRLTLRCTRPGRRRAAPRRPPGSSPGRSGSRRGPRSRRAARSEAAHPSPRPRRRAPSASAR